MAGKSIVRGVILHIIVIGGMAMAAFGAPAYAIAVLVIVKTLFDVLTSTGDEIPDEPPAWLIQMGEKMGKDVRSEWEKQMEQIRSDELPITAGDSDPRPRK